MGMTVMATVDWDSTHSSTVCIVVWVVVGRHTDTVQARTEIDVRKRTVLVYTVESGMWRSVWVV